MKELTDLQKINYRLGVLDAIKEIATWKFQLDMQDIESMDSENRDIIRRAIEDRRYIYNKVQELYNKAIWQRKKYYERYTRSIS